jgi:hypothetical protein
MRKLVIAVDFDGTLFDTKDGVLVTNMRVVYWVKKKKKEGHKIILWTSREGEDLEEAIDACEWVDLEFDAINENIPENRDLGPGKRKVIADIYLDDRSMKISDIPNMPKVTIFNAEKQKDGKIKYIKTGTTASGSNT